MITFFNEDISFNLKHKVKTKSWLKKVAELEDLGWVISTISFAQTTIFTK
jgi:hypothetical protein